MYWLTLSSKFYIGIELFNISKVTIMLP